MTALETLSGTPTPGPSQPLQPLLSPAPTTCFAALSHLLSSILKAQLARRRWKGENVATTEVAGVLEALDFLQEVNVYGVRVPGA